MHSNGSSDAPPAPPVVCEFLTVELTPDNILGTIVLMAIAQAL